MFHDYQLSRAIRGLLDPRQRGAENELSDSLKPQHGGLVVPWEALGADAPAAPLHGTRADTTSALGTIDTEARIRDAEQGLRAPSLLREAGAKVLRNLQGVVEIPVVNGAVAQVGTENALHGGVTGTTTAAVTLAPKAGRAIVPISRTLMIQTGGAIERLVRDDLDAALWEAVDADGLTAIMATATPVEQDGSDTFVDIVALRTAVQEAKIPNRRRAYVVDPTLAGLLSLPHSSGIKLYDFASGSARLNGTPAFESFDVGDSSAAAGDPVGLLYGDFSFLVVGLFGPGPELVLGEMSDTGQRMLRAFLDFDTKVTRSVAFSKLVAPTP